MSTMAEQTSIALGDGTAVIVDEPLDKMIKLVTGAKRDHQFIGVTDVRNDQAFWINPGQIKILQPIAAHEASPSLRELNLEELDLHARRVGVDVDALLGRDGGKLTKATLLAALTAHEAVA